MKLTDFEEFVRVHIWREQASAMANLERDLLDYRNPPSYWVHDLKEYLAEKRASLTRPEYLVPKDLRDNHSLEQAREVSRNLVARFGQLLCHWPDMVEAARSMRARGERLAIPL